MPCSCGPSRMPPLPPRRTPRAARAGHPESNVLSVRRRDRHPESNVLSVRPVIRTAPIRQTLLTAIEAGPKRLVSALSRMVARLRDPWTSIGAGLGLVGVVSHVLLDRSSGGSAIFVVLPILIGLALGVSGIRWLRFRDTTFDSYRCEACGYDLSGLPRCGDAVRCPECGGMNAEGAKAPRGRRLRVRMSGFLICIPGVLLVLGSALFLLIAFVYSVAWQSGWLGDL